MGASMGANTRSLVFILLAFLVTSCGSAAKDETSGGPSVDPGTASTGPTPSPAGSCGQAVGGDQVPPACANPGRSSEEARPRVLAGPISVAPGNAEYEVKVTVTGSGGMYLHGGTTLSNAPSSGTCRTSCSYLVNGVTSVTLTPTAGHTVFDPANDQDLWPAPCAGQDGRTTCEFELTVGVIMNTDMHFSLRPATTTPESPTVTPGPVETPTEGVPVP
jgi:hypothetical protein